MNCVILQPSYIPWRGFFHQIWKADVFVYYDDVQYDARGWRNRNRIKTAKGLQWLTIPVHHRGSQTEHIPIHQIRTVQENNWQSSHWNAIRGAYAKAPFFRALAPQIEPFYQKEYEFLADFTCDLTTQITRLLKIDHTQFLRSSRMKNIAGSKTDRLISVLKEVGADHYISGPSAGEYIEEEKFRENGISLEFMVYDYPEYPQLYPPFEPQASILDLLFMTGEEALHYIITDKK